MYFRGLIFFVVCPEHVIIVASYLDFFVGLFSVLGLSVTKIKPNENFPLYGNVLLCVCVEAGRPALLHALYYTLFDKPTLCMCTAIEWQISFINNVHTILIIMYVSIYVHTIVTASQYVSVDLVLMSVQLVQLLDVDLYLFNGRVLIGLSFICTQSQLNDVSRRFWQILTKPLTLIKAGAAVRDHTLSVQQRVGSI